MTGLDWTGPRRERFGYAIVDGRDQRSGFLGGVTGCKLDVNQRATIHASGNLYVDVLEGINWGSVRVQPWIVVDDYRGNYESHPLGVFVPKVPDVEWSSRGASVDVQLFDKLVILDDEELGDGLSLGVGTNVVAAAVDVIRGTGEDRVAFTASDRTLSSPMYWGPTAKKLRVVNDLLVDVLGWQGVWVDPYGVFQLHPYVDPSRRPIGWEFRDGPRAIYRDKFKASTDLWDLPNELVGFTSTDGDADPIRAVAVAGVTWANHPSKLGGRTIRRTLEDLDVAPADLQAYLDRRLASMARPAEVYEVEFAWVPLPMHGAAWFASSIAGVDRRVVYPKRSYTLEAGAMVKAEFQAVAS